jgi:paired amphipathic helix protein Sin3a
VAPSSETQIATDARNQVQLVLADARNQELLDILRRERAMASPTIQDQIKNRRNAEKVLGPDENLFRIDWVRHSAFAQGACD